MIRALALLPLLLASMALFDAGEAEALSCQRRIVTRGDSMAKVTALCGDPTTRVERNVTRSQTVARRGPHGSVWYETVRVDVHVAQWVYDFGPLRLMQELTFEDGTLISLRTLGHGHRADRLDCAGERPTDYVVHHIIRRRHEAT